MIIEKPGQELEKSVESRNSDGGRTSSPSAQPSVINPEPVRTRRDQSHIIEDGVRSKRKGDKPFRFVYPSGSGECHQGFVLSAFISLTISWNDYAGMRALIRYYIYQFVFDQKPRDHAPAIVSRTRQSRTFWRNLRAYFAVHDRDAKFPDSLRQGVRTLPHRDWFLASHNRNGWEERSQRHNFLCASPLEKKRLGLHVR